MPNRTTQPPFYRSIPFFEQTFLEIPADSVDVPNLRYAKFYNKFEGRLDVGMLFKTKEELMEAKQDHSIQHARREYYVSESSRTKWRVLCKAQYRRTRECNPSYEIKHVIQNVKDQIGNFKNMVLKDLCWQVGSKYQLRKFNRIMEEIKKQNVGAFVFLDQINKEKWTASHDGGWRYGILTTNMSECINGVLKGAHRLPDGSVHYVVNLAHRTCNCRVWDIKGIPCRHAALGITYKRDNLENFTGNMFTKERYMGAYSYIIHPIPDLSFWPQDVDVNPTNLKLPISKRLAGRPKKSRRKEPGETTVVKRSNLIRSKKCNGLGHNSRTCTGPQVLPTTEATSSIQRKRSSQIKEKVKRKKQVNEGNSCGKINQSQISAAISISLAVILQRIRGTKRKDQVDSSQPSPASSIP
ncbi:UNVERIFIED_CONTAM: hypothetical protein Scaly_1804200 [Sesamum calycinum]|uniref:SWIM-type domain-containing protein n=1 Tax=Sesamum calycinum TaxID=2727403 RepID=A0AAW2NVG3_9LAMI